MPTIVKISDTRSGMYIKIFKRVFDILFSSAILILTFPLLALVSIVLAVKNNGPAIFKQPRPGKDEKIFVLYKFKTMNDKRGSDGKLLPDADRLTRFGMILRRTSIDELPQFYNVLLGDMSVIGPRPLLVSYLERYSPEQRKRHHVKPGITGYAQVMGRNGLSWPEKFSFDAYYAENISFWLDLKIICQTVINVLMRKGISSAGSATMEEFLGN
jgi:undecaprenyl phosphate N,N'-diacetylbacillosamine 1-phosphate transferase